MRTHAGPSCSAGIGRIQSVMLDAAGTTAAVAVQDTEALDRVAAALADFGPQVGAPYCWLHHHTDVLFHECFGCSVQSVQSLMRLGALQVTPFAEWSRSRRAADDADILEGQAVAAVPGVARFAAAARQRLGDGHAPIKRRRLSALGDAAAEPLPRPQRTSCVLQ